MFTQRILSQFLIPFFLTTALCSNSETQSQCVLISLPLSPEGLNDSNMYPPEATVTLRKSLKLIILNSELQYSTLSHFVSNVFSQEMYDVNASQLICSEVIGVVGDLDSKMVRVIHTLSSRSNHNITL